MSEPKGPAIGAEEPSAKKASKKASSSGGNSSKKSSSSGGVSDLNAAPLAYAAAVSSGPVMGPSQLSMTPASASPVPKLHDVPRIPIAEPKPVGGDSSANSAGEPKLRASKKRTVTPPGPDTPATGVNAGPSIASANDAPTLDAASAAKQEADAEREKQAAAARREAKRQRAKELEDAKRREEIAKQAVEEAKREEEARLREARRKKELAALNANAEECQEEDEQADYEEDGFENYDDDFEDDDKPPEKNPNATLPQAKAKSKGTSGNSSNNADEALSPAELKKIQQAMLAESKELSTSRPSSSSNAKADAISNNQEQKADRKKSGVTSSIASSIAGLKQSLDPRAKRAKEILDARKFEVEKFNLFHQAPLSEQETYLSNLRRGQVRQVAIYTNDGAKSTLTQTKYPAGVDKSMHFPDDIGLDSASSSSNMTAKGAEGLDSGGADDDASMHSTVRFFKFLENAAYVCELLAEGNAMAVEQELEESKETKKRFPVTKNTVLSQHQVFPNKQFDDPAVEKLLQGRDLVAMRFSPCVSSILVTSYGPQESASKEDRDPNASTEKGVSCIWDVNQPHQALYVLKNEGLISTVNLGPNRELIVLAGTEDGSIHVWDLRRQPYRSSSSCKSPAVKFCSPTYSTCGADYRTTSQHASTIVALEMLDRNRGSGGSNNDSHNNSSSGNFQFGSMDDRGIVIIWSLIEFEAGEDALVTDKCVEIGGRVKMVMNTLIDTQQQYMLPKQPKPVQRAASSSSMKPTNTSSTANAARGFTVGPIATVFKLFPHDPNQFVIGTQTGVVYRGHRFEKSQSSSASSQYRRGKESLVSAAVVCIDFHPSAPEYFLVGYEDGCICLFQSSAGMCLSAWEEVPFGVSVSSIRWSTSRQGVFYASFSNAQILIWDLTEQANAPVLFHKIPEVENTSPVELASSLYPLALSSEMIRTSRPTIAFRCGDSPPFQFALHELSQELSTKSRDEDQEVKKLLTCIL